jgi:hypothetical protein
LVGPQYVEILDTTIAPDGKDATVIFRYEGATTTPFGRMMAEWAAPAVNPMIQQSILQYSGARTQASLHHLDAGGWEIRSIDAY